jgi:prepilin-type N-terminal cleavage/methylation domain-containing protein
MVKYWNSNRSIFPFFRSSLKGFTLIELIMVIMIIGILFMAFRSYFEIKDRNSLYGQACIETIYGQLNNFLHAGLSSKSIYNWTTTVYPDKYIIRFQPLDQLIELRYISGTNEEIYSSIVVTGNNLNYCSSNSYIMKITWDTYDLWINKGLKENDAMQFFYISGGTNIVSTWANSFLLCNTDWNRCKTMARFESDTRTISLKKQICLNFSGNDCIEWDN